LDGTMKAPATSTDTTATTAHGRGWTLAAVSVATFLLMLDLTVVNVALPDISASLGSTFSELQWVLDAYALGLAVFVLASGALADRYGRKRVFNVGFVVFIAASLACGLAPTGEALIAARGLQGVAAAVLFAVGPALIGDAYHGKDRGFAFGIFGGVSGMAIAFGPLIGGGLTEQLSWQWVFLVNVPLGSLALGMSVWRTRESRAPHPLPLDWWGLLTFSAAVTSLVVAFMRAEGDGWTSTPILVLFAASVALGAAFLRIEARLGDRAMVELALFRSPTMRAFSFVTLIAGAAVMAAIFLIISYVQGVWGLSAWDTGVRFLPLTVTLCLAAVVAGSLTTKLRPSVLVGTSLAAIAVGLALVVRVEADSSWTSLLPAMLFIGLGMGLFNPARASLSIAVVEPAKAGMGSGVSETFQQVGVAVGIAALGTLFNRRVQDLFLESDAATALAGQAEGVAELVATGGALTTSAADLDPALAAQIVRDAGAAASGGLHLAMTIAAVAAGIASVVAFSSIRSRDLFTAPAEHEPAGEVEATARA
jgi:EmrB/QacA subfamily drug resistance transporter